MKILICFDAPVEGRGTINGHAFHEVESLTQKEITRVCTEQRTLIQRSLARTAGVAKQAPMIVQDIVLRSITPIEEDSRILRPS